MPLQNALGARAEPQIDKADDAGNAPRRSVFTGRAHRRDPGNELGLAEGLQLFRPVGAVHLAGLLIAGGADVVATADIGEQLREQITVARPVPEMMVRIDDRQRGLDDLLTVFVEPVLADRSLDRQHGGRRRSLGECGTPCHRCGAGQSGAPGRQHAP